MAGLIAAAALSLFFVLTFGDGVRLPETNVYVYGDIEVHAKSAVLTAPFMHLRKRDTYVVFAIGSTYLGKTRTVKDDDEPQWNSLTRFYVAHYLDTNPVFKLMVVDHSTLEGDKEYGQWTIPLKELVIKKKIEGTYNLRKPKNDKEMSDTIRIKIVFRDADRVTSPFNGWAVESTPGYVDRIRPVRRGNRVTLYSNAHTGDHPIVDSIPEHDAQNCWEDTYRALLGAKQFIMMTGWSVVHTIRLVRTSYITDPEFDPDNGMLQLGELLARKAQQGVTVLILVWRDHTGKMATGWTETEEYFKGTGVHVAVVDRPTKAYLGSLMITHHQKSVIVDAPGLMPGAERRLVAFVGGLDISNGRWDTPYHPLFTTLQTYHAEDFYSALLPETVDQAHGPREPWHDIHTKLEGPIAQDVVWNFAVRWLKQTEDSMHGYLGSIPNKYIKNIVREIRELKEKKTSGNEIIPNAELDNEQHVVPVSNRESWASQLFRSIDGYAAYDLNEGYGQNTLDKSIQLAYIHLIRRARKFIFIENQYFFGSAQFWDKGKNTAGVEANHLVPVEIARAIVRRILRRERFAVYVLMPMYPEGKPQDSTVQEILVYQYKTVTMMYSMINEALRRVGSKDHPTDYLNFYCAGTREEAKGEVPDVEDKDSFQAKILKLRRSPIYVHSKMMIVDDTYIIAGSANINGRSLAGSRDSELAVGSFQPGHTMEEEEDEMPKGAVHRFRRQLFSEHTHDIADECIDPSSIACVKFMNKIATDNWETYLSPDVVDMKSHLLKYPYTVNKFEDNPVSTTFTYFPDGDQYHAFVFNPNVQGTIHSIIKDLLPKSIGTALFS